MTERDISDRLLEDLSQPDAMAALVLSGQFQAFKLSHLDFNKLLVTGLVLAGAACSPVMRNGIDTLTPTPELTATITPTATATEIPLSPEQRLLPAYQYEGKALVSWRNEAGNWQAGKLYTLEGKEEKQVLLEFNQDTQMWFPTGYKTWREGGRWLAGKIDTAGKKQVILAKDAAASLWLPPDLSRQLNDNQYFLVNSQEGRWIIEGVKDLTLKTDGTAELVFQEEKFVFPAADIRLKDGKLWVAGYEWTGSDWEVILPQYSNDPRADYPRFSEIDVYLGNWVHYHRQVFAEVSRTNDLFEGALTPLGWKVTESSCNFADDVGNDDKPDLIHDWTIIEIRSQDEITREIAASRAGVSFAFLADLDLVGISNDLMNADRSITPLLMVEDPVLWYGKAEVNKFYKDLFAFALPQVIPPAGVDPWLTGNFLWPIAAYGSDSNVDWFGVKQELPILSESVAAARRIKFIAEATNAGVISVQASDELWGVGLIST